MTASAVLITSSEGYRSRVKIHKNSDSQKKIVEFLIVIINIM